MSVKVFRDNIVFVKEVFADGGMFIRALVQVPDRMVSRCQRNVVLSYPKMLERGRFSCSPYFLSLV